MNDPELICRQPKKIWEDCRPSQIIFGSEERDPRNLAKVMGNIRDCLFHPREAIAIGNYFVWDHAKYTYPWMIKPDDEKRLAEARINEALNRKAAGWPEHYANPLVFNEKLKTR